MKALRCFAILALLVVVTACNKRKYPSINDLKVKIELVNDQGDVTQYFIKGHDITFKYSITNISEKTFFYHHSPCPKAGFEVYKRHSGEYIGNPIGEDYTCTEPAPRVEIGPGETHVHAINYFDNPHLPNLTGQYKVFFSSYVSVLEGKEHRTFDLEKSFVVR